MTESSFLNYGLLVGLGLLPSIIWLIYFYRRDCHPEPKSLIGRVFLMGIIISPIAVFLQLAFNNISSLYFFQANTAGFFLWAALVEEIVKFVAVWSVAIKHPSFDEPVDAMIYMITAGLGFAAIENILVLFKTIPDGINVTLGVLALRFTGATLLHALSSAVTGYFLALAWFSVRPRRKFIFGGIVFATFFHFVFNIFLATTENQTAGLAMATGLLVGLSLLVSILFQRSRDRSQNISEEIRLA